jgi:hypothetical protein
MPDEAAPPPGSGTSKGRGARGRTWLWPTILVVAILVTAGVTYEVIRTLNASEHGCGFNKVNSGNQVCIQWVELSIGTAGTSPPSGSSSCPNLVAPTAEFVCWVNVTNSLGSSAQNVTNISVGNLPTPFSLVSLSDPLPLTVDPGQVAVEQLSLRAPAQPGAYNLLLQVEVTATA